MQVSIYLLVALVCTALCDVNEKARLAAQRVDSEFPGLLAPHHNPNADPCKDPFHSFLCTPTKRRNRIDGRLRPGALPVPKIKDIEQPLESGSALSPSQLPSSTNQVPSREYLPTGPEQPPLDPVQAFQSNNSLQSVLPPYNAYLPIGPDASNNNQIFVIKGLSKPYLPPDEPSVTGESTNLSPNIEGGALLPTSLRKDSSKHHEESHTLERLCNDPFHSFLCKPLKPRRRIDGKIRPEAKIPPNVLVGESSIAREARVLPFESGSALLSAGQPSKNYLPTAPEKPNPQGPYVYNRPANSFIYPSNGNPYNSQPSSTSTTSAPPVYQSPSRPNLQYYNYPTLPPKPQQEGENQRPTNIQQNFARPDGYNYQKPQNQYTFGTTVSPTTTYRPTVFQTSTYPTYQTTTSRPYTYPTTQKPLTDYQYPNPSNVQQNFVRPQGQSGYNYQKPTNQFTYGTTLRPSTTYRPQTIQTTTYRPTAYPTTTSRPYTYQTTQKFESDNQYPNPSNEQPSYVNPASSDGYNYQKPLSPFTYGTSIPAVTTPPNTFPTFQTTTKRPTTFYQTTQRPVYQYPNPSNIQNNFVRPDQGGYNYQKPSTTFSYSTTQRPTVYQTTARPKNQTTTYRPYETTRQPAPNYEYSPTNIQQNAVGFGQQSGYNYQKPSQPFPTGATVRPTTTYRPSTFLTSTYRPTTTNSPFTYQTTPVQDYQYPKPSNVQQTFAKPQGQSGYNYPKPASPFTYGTTTRPPVYQTSTLRPTYQTTNRPVTYQTTTNRPFTYQTTSKPVQDYQYAKPSNVNPSFVNSPQSGYNYPKPSSPFPRPTTRPPTFQTSTYRPTYQTSTFNPTTYQTTTKRPYTYQTTPKPLDSQYANPSNVQPNVVSPSQDGYNYQKPANPFTYGTTPRPTTTVRPVTFQTSTYRPTYQTSTFRPVTYSTTTKRPYTYQTTSRPLDNQFANPSNVQNNFARPDGYNYPKPAASFTYGTTVRPSPTTRPTFQTTTSRPTYQTTTYRPQTVQTTQRPEQEYQYQKPSNIDQNFIRPQGQSGYTYQKPSTQFTYSTTPRPTTTYRPSTFQSTTYKPTYQTSTARPTTYQTTRKPLTDYQYPNPSNVNPSFVKPQSGYNYEKPASPFTYGTSARPVFQTTYQTTTRRPVTYQTTSRPQESPLANPSNLDQNVVRPEKPNGYNYPRPSVPFPPPTSQPPTLNQNPSNIQPSVVKPNNDGYDYRRPLSPLNYPKIKQYSNSRDSQSPFQNPFGNQESRSDEDGNQLDVRSFKFGERLQPRLTSFERVQHSHHVSSNDDFQPLRNFEII